MKKSKIISSLVFITLVSAVMVTNVTSKNIVLPVKETFLSVKKVPEFPQIGLQATHIEQAGNVPAGAVQENTLILSNEPNDGNAYMRLDFDLSSVAYPLTPLARLQIKDVSKINCTSADT